MTQEFIKVNRRFAVTGIYKGQSQVCRKFCWIDVACDTLRCFIVRKSGRKGGAVGSTWLSPWNFLTVPSTEGSLSERGLSTAYFVLRSDRRDSRGSIRPNRSTAFKPRPTFTWEDRDPHDPPTHSHWKQTPDLRMTGPEWRTHQSFDDHHPPRPDLGPSLSRALSWESSWVEVPYKVCYCLPPKFCIVSLPLYNCLSQEHRAMYGVLVLIGVIDFVLV